MKDTLSKRRWLHFASRGLRSLRKSGPRRLLLGVGYGASVLTTAFVVSQVGQASDYLLIVVCLNLILLLTLIAAVVIRVVKIARTRSADAGARLHLRFVFLFSLAAVVPAIIVALAVGLTSRSLDQWFSHRVQNMVENGAQVALSYISDQLRSSRDAMSYIQTVIDTPNGRELFNDRLAFSMALKNKFDERGDLTAVYVIDKTGQVLARAEGPDAPTYEAPPQEKIDDVLSNGAAGFNGLYGTRLLYPLQNYNGAILYGIKSYPPGLGEKLNAASDATVEYRDTGERQARAQGLFFMAYLETVLLVLIGAIWVGTSFAEGIALPIARLVQAAGRVAGGDLNARVITARQSEDIAVLSRAFNHMTSDLQSQQLALKSAGEEAESRRRFIETVLSEISAGIVGIDVLGHVSAINRHAANFLAIKSEDALGETLRSLAPEIIELLDKVSIHRVEEVEVDLVRRGETRRVRVRASGLETGGAVLTFDDITRLIAAQRNAAWKDVARRIAHEIKNPLTPIQLSAERIRKKYRGQITAEVETFDRLTDTIVRQVGDIGRMVDEFSSFARMPAPNFAEEEAAELVRSCVFAQRVARPDISMEIIEPLPEVKVVCDGRMLGQALGNVLKNGGEAISSRLMRDRGSDEPAPNDGILGHLRIEMRLEDNELIIEVEDDGIGLPEKDRDRLTEPYVTTREKGTGLGLAIVKRILEDHGGEFYLNDAVHLSGARAVLRLPRLQTGQNPLAATEGQSGSKLGSPKVLAQRMVEI